MTRQAAFSYQPALDGVRALAVMAVVLFHAEVPGFDGGYLGVSVFFTLSGFLITSLLVAETDRSGGIDIGGFYVRRAKRLLPASLVCLALVVLVGATTTVFDEVTELRVQVIGSLLHVANWVFLAGDGSYQELFAQSTGTVSPLEHYWSLAIEEQFYWVWPVVFALIVRWCRNRRAQTIAVGVLTVATAISAPIIAGMWGADAAYWATPARVSEILIGALLAMVISGRTVSRRWGAAGPLGLVVLALGVAVFPASGGLAYQGALPLVAVVSAAMILGLQTLAPLRRTLSSRPLVWLGGLSYGIYLFHWPIFVVVDADRLGFGGPALFVVRIGLTLLVAETSARLIERPIRAWKPTARPTLIGSATATVGVALLAIVVLPVSTSGYWGVDEAVAESVALEPLTTPASALVAPSTATPTTTTGNATTTTGKATTTTSEAGTAATRAAEEPLPALLRPVRIIVSGDSTAEATGTGLIQWALGAPALAQVEVYAAPGCGFVRGGELLIGDWRPVEPLCERWAYELLVDEVALAQPDVVMLMTTTWDALDRRWPDTESTDALNPTDPAYQARLMTDFGAISDALLGAGAGRVVWVQHAAPNPGWNNNDTGQGNPARHDALHTVMDGLAANNPKIDVIDLASWLEQEGIDVDPDARPDGVHWDPAYATAIAEDFLGEELVRSAVELTAPTSAAT